MKYIKSDIDWRKIFVFLAMAAYGFLRVLTKSIMMMPAMLIVALAIAFYFAPEQLLSDVINSWNSASTDEKITMIRIFLKGAFLLSFAACFMDALIVYPRYAITDIKSLKGVDKL
ncbi:hypothetical protein QTR19_004390 [Salmonella enterica]|nr:hypothetical protein [Salmonella enterica]ELX6092191.1 hypothetical protein [Salmonella enterica]